MLLKQNLQLDDYQELMEHNIVIKLRGTVWRKEKSAHAIILYLKDKLHIITCFFSLKHNLANQVTLETVIEVEGTLQPSSFRSFQAYELLGKSIKLLSAVSASLDDIKDVLPSMRFLFIRKPDIQHLLTIKRKIRKYLIEYIDDLGFEQVETPIITSFSPFDRTAIKISRRSAQAENVKFLSQTAQFYLEAFVHSFNKVYTFAPVFRTDTEDSNLILAEFWLLEVESTNFSFEDIISLHEQLIVNVSKRLINENEDLLYNYTIHRYLAKCEANEGQLQLYNLKKDFWEIIEQQFQNYKLFLTQIKTPFPRRSYQKAVKYLREKGEFFQGTHFRERLGDILTAQDNKPLFITHWPTSNRPFYAKKCPVREKFSHTYDLIAPGRFGELGAGGEREFREDKIIQQIKDKRLRKDNNKTLNWYTQFQKYGSQPHAGFSIGLERTTAWLTKSQHINTLVGFPRRIKGTNLVY